MKKIVNNIGFLHVLLVQGKTECIPRYNYIYPDLVQLCPHRVLNLHWLWDNFSKTGLYWIYIELSFCIISVSLVWVLYIFNQLLWGTISFLEVFKFCSYWCFLAYFTYLMQQKMIIHFRHHYMCSTAQKKKKMKKRKSRFSVTLLQNEEPKLWTVFCLWGLQYSFDRKRSAKKLRPNFYL